MLSKAKLRFPEKKTSKTILGELRNMARLCCEERKEKFMAAVGRAQLANSKKKRKAGTFSRIN